MEEVRTLDGVECTTDTINNTMMLLSGCSTDTLEVLEVTTFFRNLSEKFIQSITEEELVTFTQHHVAMRLLTKIID